MRINRPTPKESGKKPNGGSITIHNIYLLDKSSSMQGEKYTAAKEGLKQDVESIKKLISKDVVYTMSLVEFASEVETKSWFHLASNYTLNASVTAHGNTALYEALGNAIERALQDKKKEDKVLVKVFTDGEENNSKGKYAPKVRYNRSSPELANLIKQAESDGITVTFIGTAHDTQEVIKNLGIDESNTLVHNNTAEDITRGMDFMSGQTVNYSARVSRGENVSKGFYKNVDKK